MYQKITMIGFVGNKDEPKYTPQGTQVARFSIAANTGYGDKKKVMWAFVSAFGKTAEFIEKYVHVGNVVMVEGEMRPDENGNPRVYTSKSGTTSATYEITARDIKLMPSGKRKETAQEDKYDDAFPF